MSGVPERLWLSTEQVVTEALRDLDRGRSLSVAGPQYKVIVAGTRLLPTGVRRQASSLVRRRLNR